MSKEGLGVSVTVEDELAIVISSERIVYPKPDRTRTPTLGLDIHKGEFLENQILEIDHGLSCFDTNDGDVSTSDGLAVVVPFGQDLRSDLAPTTNLCDTQINCLSVPNPPIVFSSDVSDSGSLSVGGKVVPARQKWIVRVASDSVISIATGGALV
nr:hypothetical protein CFP56_28369 [Quercus suber]